MKALKKKIISLVDKKRDEIIAFHQKLISFNTEIIDYGKKGNEGEAQSFIAQIWRKMGLQVDVFEPDIKKLKKYRDYIPGHNYQGRPNVVGILKGKGQGPSLLLNAHIDTVPAAPLSSWKHHPYKGEIENGRIYGRGSSDDKSGVTTMTMLVMVLQELKISLPGDLILESVVDEEGDGNGTLACCERGYRADAGLVLECSAFEPLYLHPGVSILELTIFGKSTHYSKKYTPEEGVNAIDKIGIILEFLDKLEKKRILALRKSPYFPKIPLISVNRIWGGESIGTLAEKCTIQVVLEYFMEEADKDGGDALFKRKIVREIRKMEKGDSWLSSHPCQIKWIGGAFPAKIEKTHPLISLIQKNVYKILKKKVKPNVAFTTGDIRHLIRIAKTPSIQFGPPSGGSHAIDEFIEIEALINGIKIIALTIIDWYEEKF